MIRLYRHIVLYKLKFIFRYFLAYKFREERYKMLLCLY